MRQCGCTFHLIHKADICNDDCAHPVSNQGCKACVRNTHTIGNHVHKRNLGADIDYHNTPLKFRNLTRWQQVDANVKTIMEVNKTTFSLR